jgi:hypothetical protein
MNDLMLVEKLAHWEKLKTLVLDASPLRLQRGFITWL